MENRALSIDELSLLMDEQCLVLTANSRQRRFLLKHSSQTHNEGLSSISSERLLSFQQWLNDVWQQLQNNAYAPSAQLLISPQQNLVLWQDIIDSAEESADLICPDLLAKQASSAWQLLSEWEVDPNTLAEYNHKESDILSQWGLKFDQTCQQLSLIGSAEQCQIVSQAFAEGILTRERKLIMVGFDDLSPLRDKLSHDIADEVLFVQLKHLEHNRVYTLPCDDANDEIRRCAEFVRQELSQAVATESPMPRIGIIDPKLGQRRDKIERVFSEVLEPQYLYSKTPRYTLPFNFSAGFPLANCPLIDAALALLSLNLKQLDVERLCQLIYSPFWHQNAEQENDYIVAESQQLEFHLRQLQQEQIRPAQLRQCAEKVAQRLADHPRRESSYISISERLQGIFYGQERRPDRNSAKQWSQIFYQQLEELNWPGSRRLDSNEYQQVMQFQNLLEELLSLDHLNRLYSAGELLNQLQQLASSHHFQAKTPDSPVQILGILEGSGQAFDYCWVMGMEQKQWPPSPQANPLLPIELQRRLNMPHASVERELYFASQLVDAYRLCADTVIFSYPSREGEEQLQCSPLIQQLKSQLITSVDALLPDNAAHELEQFRHDSFERRHFHWVDNRQGPKLSSDEKKLGGSGVLKQQALCPFNAFAQYRLGAKPWPEVQIGISPIERGNILHLALETFWEAIKSQEALLVLDDQALNQIIKDHISDAIESELLHRRDLGPRFRALEAERLHSLFTAFIEQDKQRPPFRIAGLESSRELKLGPLKLQLRLDRIDTLLSDTGPSEPSEGDNESYLVIDYKTGQCDVKSWLGDRPEEPQLPLYSLSDPAISAISFAQLNAKGVKYIGISRAHSPASGISNSQDPVLQKKLRNSDSRLAAAEDIPWSQLRQQWHTDLLQLAIRYSEGQAQLDFKDPLAKRYSEDLEGLQRLKEFDAKRRYWNDTPAALQQAEFDLSL
ncbi:PD-(D/E)XK nuclease family protein [Pseudoteredinibacter isoporae]|uniref:PD-(D/E)XK nuclease family protein n=1 Tax=Pseudoteredinibacter isoporae TaxID=570281 RepID=UPI003107354C